jgi:hypothetical protein
MLSPEKMSRGSASLAPLYRGQTVGGPKQIVFYYGGKAAVDETMEDWTGELKVPEKGDIRIRKGMSWKVELVMIQHLEGPLPIYKVFLDKDKG